MILPFLFGVLAHWLLCECFGVCLEVAASFGRIARQDVVSYPLQLVRMKVARGQMDRRVDVETAIHDEWVQGKQQLRFLRRSLMSRATS